MKTRLPRTTFGSALSLVALLAVPAAAGEGARFAIEQDQVFVGYQLQAGSKQIAGMSRALEGSITALPDGGAQVRLRIPVASFESGVPGFDALLRHSAEADKFPSIEFEGLAPPASGKDTLQFAGSLRAHGVEQRVTVPVKVVRDGSLAFAHLSFHVGLASFGIARPALGALVIGDKIEVSLDARLHQIETGQVIASSF